MPDQTQSHDEDRDDDLKTLLDKIASQLADLSVIEELPLGYKLTATSFEPDAVDFSTNGWLLKLFQVHPWLNPEEELEASLAEGDAQAFALSFFKAMGAENPRDCINADGGLIHLSAEGAEKLSSRLDTALKLQQVFATVLEDSSRRQASDAWREAWDDEGEEEPASERINAKTETCYILELCDRAAKKRLNLTPSYQRGDVWPLADAQKLIVSIVRGIPLPSIILLQPASKENVPVFEVVDGKQRLTSILRFAGKHPVALKRVQEEDARFPEAKLTELFRRDYRKFRRMWKRHVGEPLSAKKEAEYYFPFPLPDKSKALQGPLAALAGKYYYEIADETIQLGEGPCSVQDVFQGSWYKIPVIVYMDSTPRQIHEVFHLYNRQGKHLNAEEIRNALFHELDLLRLLFVASGDNLDVDELAPYITRDRRPQLAEIAEALRDYKFGTLRYRRTKLLSWLCALLLQPSETGGILTVRSTAKQIDTLLDSIRNASSPPGHRLSDHGVLNVLLDDLHEVIEAHSACSDCWDDRFKDNDDGSKWQELQLVASLLGTFLIRLVTPDVVPVLQSKRAELVALTHGFPRPEKTQNKTQWSYIGKVALGIAAVAGIAEADIAVAQTSKYGVSCIPTLRAASAQFKARAEE